ncbi:MAG: DUF5518 domain-containing protein [Halosimplex sp.]
MDEGNTLLNALVGAVVTTVASSFVPFAPVLGGALAGYFQGGTRTDGLTVGAVSGAIALIPVAGIMFLVFSLIGVVSFGAGNGAPLAIGGALMLFFFLFLAVYTVGLSVLGGWIGNYVKYDTDIGS